MIGLAILFLVALMMIAIVGGLLIGRGLERPRRRGFGNALAYGLPTSPGELGFDFLEIELRLSDSTHSPGWLARLDTAPDKPLVIITHGWGESRYSSLTRLSLLRDVVGYVLIYDARGHGDSTAKRFDLATTEAADILALIPQAFDAIGGERKVVLFGHSMGGGVSIVAAALQPEAIAGVVAEGVYRHMMEPVRGFLRVRRAPWWLFMPVLHLFSLMKMPSAKVFDRAAHAARMPQPLLVVHGTEDRICEYASGKAIAEAAPRGRLLTLEGAGHLELAAEHEQRYREALAEFFAELRGEQDTTSPGERHDG